MPHIMEVGIIDQSNKLITFDDNYKFSTERAFAVSKHNCDHSLILMLILISNWCNLLMTDLEQVEEIGVLTSNVAELIQNLTCNNKQISTIIINQPSSIINQQQPFSITHPPPAPPPHPHHHHHSPAKNIKHSWYLPNAGDPFNSRTSSGVQYRGVL